MTRDRQQTDHRRRRPAAELPRLTLAGEGGLPGWLNLGEHKHREIASGAVGKFWQPNIEWRDMSADHFTSFNEPGCGKIAAAVTTEPNSARRTATARCVLAGFL